MGNTRSALFEQVSVDPWWNNDQSNPSQVDLVQTSPTTTNANEARTMEVQEEISSLHEKRRKIIAEKKKEFDDLRQELAQQKKENEQLKIMLQQGPSGVPNLQWDYLKVDISQQTDTFEVPGQSENQYLPTQMEELQLQLKDVETIKEKNRDLLTHVAGLQKELQTANSELAAFENERQEYKTHVTALKDIITVSKQLLSMREKQIKELSQKIEEIQASLADMEFSVLSDDLRNEYARQLTNIKQLRVLYEERQRADKIQVDSLKNQLDDAKNALKAEEARSNESQERVDELEKDNVEKSGSIINLQSQLGFSKAECGELRAEMAVINQLFSQILLGFNSGQEIDLDKLIKTLEENHDLLTEIVTNGDCTEISSALPKVLLDLVSQVNNKSQNAAEPSSQEEPKSNGDTTLASIAEESESQTSTQQNSLSSASEIVQNLPKVWRVLTELLSHQIAPVSVLNDNNDQTDKNPCYKSVQTPTGPTLVLSVSKTFIRLKDLIVEKKSLEKETSRLKQLNTHLETRLQDQEKRLGTVSQELSKTWHVVGKMQKQHQQLHTQEKILRYELAQKRKLLNELKEELEYCREKWLQAREKNSTTEEQWKQLRNEFASRKNTISEDLNNSVESGYSDDRESSSSDDDDVVESELDLSVASPEPIPGCSSLSENVEAFCDVDTGSVETVVNVAINEGNEKPDETILKVVRNEIAKIENTGSPEAGSSTHQLEKTELSALNTEDSSQTSTQEITEVSAECQSSLNDKTAETLVVSAEENKNETSSLVPEETTENATIVESETDGSGSITECFESSSVLKRDDFNNDSGHQSSEVPNSSSDNEKIADEHPIQHSSSSQQEEYTEVNTKEEECVQGENLEESKPTDEQEEIVLNRDRRTEEVHSDETLKTELVQSASQEVQKTTRTPEEILAAREERLKRLEQEAKDLVTQTTNTSNRSVEICTKLEDLHEQYGSDPKTRRKDIDDMYKRLEEDILQTIKKTQSGEDYPSTSRQNRTTDEILAAREERLKRLEEESNKLVNRATRTSHRGTEISSKLDNLHQQYGEGSKQKQKADTDNNSGENASASKELEENVFQPTTETQNEDDAQELLQRLENESRTVDGSSEVSSKLVSRQTEDTDTNLEEASGVSTIDNSEPSTSSSRNPEEMLARREERLQRMEEEARELMGKALKNSFRGVRFCRKLDRLHDRYGTSSESDEGADDNNNTADGAENIQNEAYAQTGGEAQRTEEGSDCTNSNQDDTSQAEEQS